MSTPVRLGHPHNWHAALPSVCLLKRAAPVYSGAVCDLRMPCRCAHYQKINASAAPVPSPRPEITGIDAGAQCQYSPCE